MITIYNDLDEKFEQTVGTILKTKTISSKKVKLKLYGLYKQAKFGNNKTEKPCILDFKGKEKWNTWNNEAGKEKNKAKIEYIELVNNYIS
jgi:acyl-CoA-binding protein